MINERPTIVYYDHVKSTVDNWQQNERPKRRIRPKLLQVDNRFSRCNEISFCISLDTRTAHDSRGNYVPPITFK